jgi:ribosomal-protein-serine acetyltransferase
MSICSLRVYAATDAEALYEAARESVAKVYPWLPWCHPDYTLAEAVEWVSSRAQLIDAGQEYHFAIAGSDGRFLGGCSLNQINRIHRYANLGYWVRTSETGRGVATEVVRQLAEFAFQNTDLVRLEIVCAVGNGRSQRVAERAGAYREGILRHRLVLHGEPVDAVMYSLVRQGMGDYIVDQINFQLSCWENLHTGTTRVLAEPLVAFMKVYLAQLETEIGTKQRQVV